MKKKDLEQPKEITESAETEAIVEEINNEEDIDPTRQVPDDSLKKRKKKNKSKLKFGNTRRFRYGTNATILVIVAIVAVFLLNLVAGILDTRFPVNLDLSASKIYTLSDQSLEIAKAIQDDVKIVVFSDESAFIDPQTGSSNGVPEFDTAIREFYSALKQYNVQSGGKLTYEFIDVDQQPAKFAAYEDYGVQSGDILFINGNRYKTSAISDLSNFSQCYQEVQYYGDYTGFESYVEKVLASKIYSITGGNDCVVQVLTGHSEDSYLVDGLKTLYELNGYTFEELLITGSTDFNKDAKVLLIPAPTTDYSNDEIKRIQQWMENDGNYGRQLMVYTDITADCPNLFNFLKVEYQITVEDSIITETDLNRKTSYNPYYTMCDVPETNHTATSVGTANVFAPYSRRLTTTLTESNDDNIYNIYGYAVNSFPTSAHLVDLSKFSGTNSEDQSYSAEQDEYPLTSMVIAVIDKVNNDTEESVSGSVMVCGTPAIAYSSSIQDKNWNNEELLLDVANTMTGAENNITISSKVLTADTVNYSVTTQLIVGVGIFTILLPLAVLIICLIVFLRRKKL